MADERYEWLDADAAEKLLRGEPVEPVGEDSRADAIRLTEALHEVRTVPRSSRELPGEAAALAAFRDASRAGRRDGAGARRASVKRSAAAAGFVEEPGTVRIGAVRTAPSRRPRWSRPLRYGLVVSLAGCALGGVAVAAGTGMLPGPFGGQGSPVPAASVSAAASPEELGSGLPTDSGPSPSPSASPGPSRSPAPSESPDAAGSGTGTSGPSGHEGGPSTGSGAPDGSGDRDGGSQGGTGGQEQPGSSGGQGTDDWYARSVKACRDHRAGTLDKESERRLIRLAKGESNLERFCDRLLDKPGSDGGDDGGSDDDDSGNGEGGGSGGGSGGGDAEQGEGDGGGSLPAISFERASPSAAASGADFSRTGDDASGVDREFSLTEFADLVPALR